MESGIGDVIEQTAEDMVGAVVQDFGEALGEAVGQTIVYVMVEYFLPWNLVKNLVLLMIDKIKGWFGGTDA